MPRSRLYLRPTDYGLPELLRQQVQVRVNTPDYFGKPWGWHKAKSQVLNILKNASTHPILDALSERGHTRQRAIDVLMHMREQGLASPQQGKYFEVARKHVR
jgi:hypothetical protein